VTPHQLVGHLQADDGVFACSDPLQPRVREPGRSFVTRKISEGAAVIRLEPAEEVVLGDVSAVCDWSFAGDITHGSWLMLQQDEPDDYVLASGVGHTVAEFAEHAFAYVGLRRTTMSASTMSASGSRDHPRTRREPGTMASRLAAYAPHDRAARPADGRRQPPARSAVALAARATNGPAAEFQSVRPSARPNPIGIDAMAGPSATSRPMRRPWSSPSRAGNFVRHP